MKGILFLVLGVAASVLLLIDVRTLRGALLLGVTIWAFCRAYYFAFYVLEKYVDPGYRFSGLISLTKHLVRTKRKPE